MCAYFTQHLSVVTLIAHNVIQCSMHLNCYTGAAVNESKISNGEIVLARSNDHGTV